MFTRALLLSTCAIAVLGECPTCVFPTWSWDTVPAFFHSSRHNISGFTEDDLNIITKFPIGTLPRAKSCSLLHP